MSAATIEPNVEMPLIASSVMAPPCPFPDPLLTNAPEIEICGAEIYRLAPEVKPPPILIVLEATFTAMLEDRLSNAFGMTLAPPLIEMLPPVENPIELAAMLPETNRSELF